CQIIVTYQRMKSLELACVLILWRKLMIFTRIMRRKWDLLSRLGIQIMLKMLRVRRFQLISQSIVIERVIACHER
ncbi:hypothetical protein PIB30_113560, partial [Stylosanthes scabra]|nr:hypothetical protein [Stylosanthes scabra]